MSEERDKKTEDRLVQEMEDSMKGMTPGFMERLRKHFDNVLGKVPLTDDEAVEEMEKALLSPPKNPFKEAFEVLNNAPLKPQVMFMTQEDFDDLKEWGMEEHDAGRSSGDPLEEQGVEEQEGGQVRLRDDDEER